MATAMSGPIVRMTSKSRKLYCKLPARVRVWYKGEGEGEAEG